MKHNYNNDGDFYKEDRKVSDSKSYSRRKYKIGQIWSAGVEKKPKRKNTSSQCSKSPEKEILPWGLMALRESDLNG